MNANLPIRRQRRSAFTLIELLVVVAIIALLISILLPSLSRARAQARTTLCGTRIAQLTKAILMYADDYDEVPPFIALGHADMDGLPGNHHGDMYPPERDELYWWSHEDWLIKDIYLLCYETDWEALDPVPSPKTGTLFTYTNFEDLYRCPDFQRGPVGAASGGLYGQPKTQNVFNYTRTVLGRKLFTNIPPISDPEADDDLSPGPILKISAVYSPAAMMMLLDEQWDFHCAGNYDHGGSVGLSGYPMAAESVHGIIGDTVGDYHGVKAREVPFEELTECKQGSIGYYDGHVALFRDPWAWRYCVDDNWLPLLSQIAADPDQGIKVFSLLLEGVFAQRGISITIDMLVTMMTG